MSIVEKVATFAAILLSALLATVMIWFTVQNLRAGNDFRFAFGVLVSAWSVRLFLRVGEDE